MAVVVMLVDRCEGLGKLQLANAQGDSTVLQVMPACKLCLVRCSRDVPAAAAAQTIPICLSIAATEGLSTACYRGSDAPTLQLCVHVRMMLRSLTGWAPSPLNRRLQGSCDES